MKNSQMDVLGLGTCNADFLMNVPRFSTADDEIDIRNLKISLGGSAANFVVGVSKQGLKTGIMARIGNDHYGSYITNEFKVRGVNTERLVEINERTGMAFVAVEPEGEKSIYTFMGANSRFKLENDDINLIKNSEILHITGMYIEVVEQASKHANILSFNPGNILSSYGFEALEIILKRTQILFLNSKEVTLLTGMDVDKGAKHLVETGVPYVIVTMGKNGSKVYTESTVIKSPSQQLKAKDTTGAGDSFAAGFISSLFNKRELKECLENGNQCASMCVTKWGAMDSPEFR